MPPKPQCPFCLKEFESVEQVTQHLIFDNCKVHALNVQDETNPEGDSSGPVTEEDGSIVLES